MSAAERWVLTVALRAVRSAMTTTALRFAAPRFWWKLRMGSIVNALYGRGWLEPDPWYMGVPWRLTSEGREAIQREAKGGT